MSEETRPAMRQRAWSILQPVENMPKSRHSSASSAEGKSVKDSRPSSSVPKQEDLSEIEVIGRDDNTRPALLPEPSPDEVREYIWF